VLGTLRFASLSMTGDEADEAADGAPPGADVEAP